MKYIGHLSLIGILLFAIACQPNAPKEEQEDKIFSRLFAQYRQSDRLFRAEAGFSAGDSLPNALPIELSTVTFQGGPMSVKQSADNKTVYKTERQGNFQEIIKFKCTMASGKKVAIDLDFDPIESFLIKDKISKNSGFTIVWKGLPLSKDESLLFLFADKVRTEKEVLHPLHCSPFRNDDPLVPRLNHQNI